MSSEFLVLQLLLVAGLALSAGFLAYCFRHRRKRGVAALTVLFSGIFVWVGSELVQIQLRDPSLAGVGMALRILGIEITVLGIFFLGLEYTGRDEPMSWRYMPVFAVVPLAEIAFALSPWRNQFFGVEPAQSAPWGYEIVVTPWFLAHTVYSYSFVVVGLGLLFAMMLRASVGYRYQLGAVFVSVLFPTLVNASYHAGLLPFDLTPVSFLITAIVLMFATFQLRLLDTIPVARRTVLEEMEDMVLVLDENDTIVTTNTAAQESFGGGSSLAGKPISCLFDIDEADTQTIQEECTIQVDGEERIINVNSSQITDYRGNLLARVLVCRDVTEQRRQETELRNREQELELLKDLQSRFLRHNLRNELNVVRANAELLADTDDPTERERYETILEKTDRILDWSTKARTIERLVETDELVSREVVGIVDGIMEELAGTYPDVTFECDSSAEVWIEAVPQVDRAFYNVLDNAARYNTASDPRVTVSIEAGAESVSVHITDNGPGIDAYEIETLRGREETPLQHATGLGLWLVYWVVDKSGGSLSFDTDEGTTVTLHFDRGSPGETPHALTDTALSDGGNTLTGTDQ